MVGDGTPGPFWGAHDATSIRSSRACGNAVRLEPQDRKRASPSFQSDKQDQAKRHAAYYPLRADSGQ